MSEKEPSKAGTWGWIALVAGVVAFDLLAPETMSNAFRRGLKSHELLTLGAWAITSAHLLNILPEEVDPFKHLHRETN